MLFDLRRKKDILYLLAFTIVVALPALVSFNAISQLETIKKNGVLRVATRNTPSTYFIEKGKPAGFEYELANAFANHLGVKLTLLVPDSVPDLFDTVKRRDAHLAAAGINMSKERSEHYAFSAPYAESVSTVIYRQIQGQKPPKTVADLIGKALLVLADSVQAEQLNALKKHYPDLTWHETTELTSTDILDQVFNKNVDYAIVDSVLFESQSSFYPGLNPAFTLGKTQPIAWLFSPYQDGSLQRAANKFLQLPETQHLISTLTERYFGRRNPLNYFDTITFRQDMETRLPKLEQYFYMAEQETDIDWMLLAAIAYQESHWRVNAVSPTGVKGIMMLTRAAAKEVGVTDRTDPIQSILGGAKYLTIVDAKIAKRITGPDRTWLTLAGYNIGFGHLEDARILTQRAKKNPDRWSDVREFLPLLSKAKYYKTVKYGYAHGQEPVQYVRNIQRYIALLKREKRMAAIRQAREAALKAEKAFKPAYLLRRNNPPFAL